MRFCDRQLIVFPVECVWKLFCQILQIHSKVSNRTLCQEEEQLQNTNSSPGKSFSNLNWVYKNLITYWLPERTIFFSCIIKVASGAQLIVFGCVGSLFAKLPKLSPASVGEQGVRWRWSSSLFPGFTFCGFSSNELDLMILIEVEI